jgi:hypothetical protein
MGAEATLQHRKIWYDRKSPAIHGRNIAAGGAKTNQPKALAEALVEIEQTIQKIHQIESSNYSTKQMTQQ